MHAAELARFESLVVRGPQADDCAIWKGAIGGDGYRRFWVHRGGGARIMVRANRYALAAAQDGEPLEPSVRALHGCDNPVCVRVSRAGEMGLLHVLGGTQRDNMEMMGRAGRGGVRAGQFERGRGGGLCGWGGGGAGGIVIAGGPRIGGGHGGSFGCVGVSCVGRKAKTGTARRGRGLVVAG